MKVVPTGYGCWKRRRKKKKKERRKIEREKEKRVKDFHSQEMREKKRKSISILREWMKRKWKKYLEKMMY